MGLIDSHAHLSALELRDRIDDVLARCRQADVERIITIGTDRDDARQAIELARRYPDTLRAAVGFHPHEAGVVTEDDLRAMADVWDDPMVVGVGEIGLDYHYDFTDRAVQRRVFARQLELAASTPHAVIIHCREALEDGISILSDCGYTHRRVVFHCFTGNAEEASRLAEQGWRISFTGIVTFPKSGELQEIAKAYPEDQLMVETDSPYLSPVPVRSKRPNEPAHVLHIARFLAKLRETPFEAVVNQTNRNTREFFAL